MGDVPKFKIGSLVYCVELENIKCECCGCKTNNKQWVFDPFDGSFRIKEIQITSSGIRYIGHGYSHDSSVPCKWDIAEEDVFATSAEAIDEASRRNKRGE